jgi:tetratricopeptide (TPR) repeat protein
METPPVRPDYGQEMDTSDPVIALCLEGTRAEFEGRKQEACALYDRAWEAAGDDYGKCIAAHYVARCQACPEAALRWNREALARADASGDARVRGFYPSLYVNMGQAHELLGHLAEAEKYYRLAAGLGLVHQAD